jgi:hypothetical protein
MSYTNGGLTAYTDERSIKDDDQLKTLIMSRFDQSSSYRKHFDDKFDKCYQYYRSYEEFDADYWYRSQIFLPYIFTIIESMTPDFITALIGGDSFFSCNAVGPQRMMAENMERLMKYQINEKMQFYQKILSYIKSILIFGNGIMYTGWKKKVKEYVRKEYINDPLFGLIGAVNVKHKEDIINDPWIDTVFIKNFFPQPYKENVTDMDWCIERCYVDWNYILKLKRSGGEDNGIWKNLDAIKTSAISSDYKSVIQEMSSLVGIGADAPEDPINKPVELLKYWRDDRVIILANRKVIIRDSENPFAHNEKPYVDGKDYPLDKEFYAIGEVELLMPLQDRVNDFTNLRIDNLYQTINHMYVVNRNAKVNPDDLISRPNGVVWSDDHNGVVPLIKKDMATSAVNEPEMAYKDMQRVSGAWEYYQGGTPDRQETATGIIKLQQAAGRRFGYRIKLLQKGPFKRILTHCMQNNQDLLPPDYTIERFEEDMQIKINPWDIAGKINITVAGSQNLIGLEDRMIQFYQLAAGNPQFNQEELHRRMLDVYDIPNADKLLAVTDQALGLMQGNMGQPNGMEMNQKMIQQIMAGLNAA